MAQRGGGGSSGRRPRERPNQPNPIPFIIVNTQPSSFGVSQVGLPPGSLPHGALPSHDTLCNRWWGENFQRTAVLEFTRDRWEVWGVKLITPTVTYIKHQPTQTDTTNRLYYD
jgi:hypothetical protein